MFARTRHNVALASAAAHALQDAGGIAQRDYWIPADEPPAFNAAISGEIGTVAARQRDEDL
jgi:hypothetical protein